RPGSLPAQGLPAHRPWSPPSSTPEEKGLRHHTVHHRLVNGARNEVYDGLTPLPRRRNHFFIWALETVADSAFKEAIMAKVAFLGLGVMGYPMAGHLKAKGGHELTVYNRTVAKAEKWVAQHGGKSAPTPKAAAEGQDFVMCCVGNDNDLREVTL